MYKAPRGTNDILPQDQPVWRHIDAVSVELFRHFTYRRIDTPLFEEAALFLRSVGEATDLVEKETYTFADRSGDDMTLRPEGTAGVCRAYLEHGMHVQPQPVRLYTPRAPMFRYDRPQAGRHRQFHQINVEAIGDGAAVVDAEIIELAWRLFSGLGLTGLTLLLNSIGDPVCRPGYLAALTGYYEPLVDGLCPDCRRRLRTNPLRLLDCKKESCQPHLNSAPRTVDQLCGPCAEHWQVLTSLLEALGLAYTVDNRLVRGLDYYTRTVFEIVPPEVGAQRTLGGGGRYDGLMEQLGGRPTPGVGFAVGVERIILNLERQGVNIPTPEPPQAVVAHLGAEAQKAALKLASSLRQRGIPTALAPAGRSLKAQMRYAGSQQASYVMILGDDEVRDGVVTVKTMSTGEQRQVPSGEVADLLAGP